MIGKTRHADRYPAANGTSSVSAAFRQGCGVLRHSPSPGNYRHIRHAPPESLKEWVEHFWLEEWEFAESSSQTREVLPHPGHQIQAGGLLSILASTREFLSQPIHPGRASLSRCRSRDRESVGQPQRSRHGASGDAFLGNTFAGAVFLRGFRPPRSRRNRREPHRHAGTAPRHPPRSLIDAVPHARQPWPIAMSPTPTLTARVAPSHESANHPPKSAVRYAAPM